MTAATVAFRTLLARDGIVAQPAVHDPLSALIAQQLGFEAIALGGYALGAHLGVSEPLLSLEDVASCVRRVTAVCDLPVMVDGGAGFGDPLHVMHAVRTLEHAGAASVHFEDQVFPKRAHYHRGIEHVIPVDQMVAKVRAAVRARRNPDFAIVARTDAVLTDGYSEGVRRSAAYAEAGADLLMLFPNDRLETERAGRDLAGIPLVYVNSEGNRLGRAIVPLLQLETWGWKVAYDAITAVAVAAAAVSEALERLRTNGYTGLDQGKMVGIRKFVEDVIGLEEYYSIEEETVERRM